MGPLAVVTADTEDDRAFLVHRVVAGGVGAHAAVEGGETARLGVAATEGPLVRAALEHGGQEPVADAGVIGVGAAVDPGEQAVLQVGHDPGAVAAARAPALVVAEVEGLHVAVAGVQAVGLGVAVVEAAAAIEVRAVEDGVHALGLVAGGDAVGVVVAVARPGGDVDAVRLVPADGDRRLEGVGEVVRPAGRPAGRRLGEVVALP